MKQRKDFFFLSWAGTSKPNLSVKVFSLVLKSSAHGARKHKMLVWSMSSSVGLCGSRYRFSLCFVMFSQQNAKTRWVVGTGVKAGPPPTLKILPNRGGAAEPSNFGGFREKWLVLRNSFNYWSVYSYSGDRLKLLDFQNYRTTKGWSGSMLLTSFMFVGVSIFKMSRIYSRMTSIPFCVI